jgi:beta-phosphoglucomutase-like phosphatase (HAD superfamily)
VLAERLGLPALNVKVMPHANDHKRFPSPDEWLKLAKLVGVPPKHCVALVSGSLATHSALSAGMRVAALPDKFTAFQDCTGADFVCETPGDLPFKELSVICGA